MTGTIVMNTTWPETADKSLTIPRGLHSQNNRETLTPANCDPLEASHPARPHPYFQDLPSAAQDIAQCHNVFGPDGQRPSNVTVHHTEQVLQAHSQSLALNQGTPEHYVASSGMTQHACSLPVDDVIYPAPAKQQRAAVISF